jgi:plastocyanin
MTRRSIVSLALWMAALAVAATACTSGAASPAPSVDGPAVAVRDYEFEPGSLTVETGATVTWVWEGRAPHNVVGWGFESSDQSSGTFRHTFEEPGTFAYQCTLHAGMEGSVVAEGVKPE